MEISEWLDSQLSQDIWNKKYRYENESFDHWLDRVSGGNSEIRRLILEKKFLFGGRILSNRGIPTNASLSNCYVLSVDDSIEDIYQCCSDMARTYSYGGGVGIDISKLRPRGARVNNSAKTTSGAVSFMQTFDTVTNVIGQNGRRAALMISIDVDHPDVEEFIDIKANTDQINSANISIRVNDNFMKAVENNSDNYILCWPTDKYETGIDTTNWEYDKLYEVNGVYYKKINPVKLFDKLVQNNYDYAEPGILYWDRIDHWNMMDKNSDFKYAGVNPCAEEPLTDGSACLLGAMNLSAYVINGQFNLNLFAEDVRIVTRGLNEVLIEGISKHPLKKQQDSAKNWRAIGLGMLDLAGALVKMGITYGSKEAIEFCEKVTKIMLIQSFCESCDLNTDNVPFDNLFESEFYKEQIFPFIPEEYLGRYPLNSQLLTIAPTGTLSTMLNSLSGGAEPAFALSYTRTTKSLHGKDVVYEIHPPLVEQYLQEHNCTFQDIPDYFITSDQLHWKNRIDMQAALQENIDASISSTLNLKEDVTLEDVKQLYIYAWKKGLKGATIFRRNCKRVAILNDSNTKPEEIIENNEPKRGDVIKADDNCIGLKRSLTTGCGSLHCEAFFDPINGELRECYLSKGSTGGCNNFMIGLSRMISLSARGGIGINAILDQLKSCGVCPSYAVRTATMKDTSKGSCCPVAVGNALRSMHEEIVQRLQYCDQDVKKIEKEIDEGYEECPSCHNKSLIRSGGCNECTNCGWSKCS